MKNKRIVLLIVSTLILGIFLGKYINANYRLIKTENTVAIQNTSVVNEKKVETAPAWVLVKSQDPFTDKTGMYVFFEDPDYRIQISNENPAIWIYITSKSGRVFENYGELEFRVDNKETRTHTKKSLELLNSLGSVKTYNWEPRTIGLRIFHGESLDKGVQTPDAPCGLISQLMTGKELKVRYQVDSLSKESFRVNIEGLKPLLIEAFGLDFCVV